MAVRRLAVLAVVLLAGGAPRAAEAVAKHLAPVPGPTLALMAAKDMAPNAPILMRTYKKEAELEVWKQTRNGRYVLLKTFPICRWSGTLGPKTRQGDRQTPEGFYPITPKLMNPNSAYYLSFDTGFPNAYDRARGASGSFLMVHGTCSSAGCFAMTDKGVGEIYALARDAFAGGQPAFQFQAYPFRMSAENMARYRTDPHIDFWRQLKEGSDRFEATGQEPVIGVAAGRYAFRPAKDPALETLATQRLAEESARVLALVAEGRAAIRTTYADGGQHPIFRALAARGAALGEISRPEALLLAGRDVVVIPARVKRPGCTTPACRTQAADAKPAAPTADNHLAADMRMAPSAPAAAIEPSVFAFVALSYGPLRPVLSGPAISGSMQVVPAVLAMTNARP